ncbi:hypothetical protein PCANB_002461 [Pneumocystis canis]|nr:hypothetical protein PCANB_002461 [Pneumocystis canis]
MIKKKQYKSSSNNNSYNIEILPYSKENDLSASLIQLTEKSPKQSFFGRLIHRKNNNYKKRDINHGNNELFSYHEKTPTFIQKSFKSFSTSPIIKSVSSYELLENLDHSKSENSISSYRHTSSPLGNSISSQTISDSVDTMKNFGPQKSYFKSLGKIPNINAKLEEDNNRYFSSSSTLKKSIDSISDTKNKENSEIFSHSNDFNKYISQELHQSITDYSELSFVSAREIFDNKNFLSNISRKNIEDSLIESNDNKNNENIDKLSKTELEYDPLIIGKSIFYGEETYVSRAKAATWLGDCMKLNSNARAVYMNQFDWTNVDILTALRHLCSKLIMKAETQQMDRILESFSKRWYECNPSSNLIPDIVHPIAYSLLLLNTDLHVADLTQGQKMTKTQFVQNTLSTIFSSAPKPKLNISEFSRLSLMDNSIFLAPTKHALSHILLPYNQLYTSAESNTNISRKSSDKFEKKKNLVELGKESNDSIYFQVEALLKNSHILQSTVNDTQLTDIHNTNSMFKIANFSNNFYSIPLDWASNLSCESLFKTNTGKHAMKKFKTKNLKNKEKAVSKVCQNNYRNSISCNINDWTLNSGNRSSINFPSIENRSVCSFNSCYSSNACDYQFSTIGFAGTLNNIIRKTSIFSSANSNYHYDNIQENELALSGPPWTKEGILKHKHYLENFKRAKNRSWIECFAVLEKGKLKLFQFNNNKFSERKGIIGGGNWIENANNIGSFILLQSLASALPFPGYSPTRPYVWVLTLPNGSVHFFQAGTRELLDEWVYTTNYWAARFSKEPLLGGISNIEYGWGQCLKEMGKYKKKIKDNHLTLTSNNSTKNDQLHLKFPGDKATIKSWNPPQLYLLTNTIKEEEQVKNLKNYIAILEKDAQKHNAYRPKILQAVSKALSNWEKRSHYLLREIVKYKTYLECLSRALILKEELLSKKNYYK